MDRLPTVDRTRGQWRGTTPAWWFGALFIAGAYVFLTPRVLPAIVPAAANNPPLHWLVGVVVGVAILSIWQVGRWVLARNRV